MDKYANKRKILINSLFQSLAGILPERDTVSIGGVTNLRILHFHLSKNGNQSIQAETELILKAWFSNLSDNFSKISGGMTESKVDFERTKSALIVQNAFYTHHSQNISQSKTYLLDLGLMLIENHIATEADRFTGNKKYFAQQTGDELYEQLASFYGRRIFSIQKQLNLLQSWFEVREVIVTSPDETNS